MPKRKLSLAPGRTRKSRKNQKGLVFQPFKHWPILMVTPQLQKKLDYLKAVKERKYSKLNSYYMDYVRRANKSGLFFNLTEEQFSVITHRACGYCGVHEEVNGIDRKDSGLGYEEENIETCCRWCNNAKANHTVNFFIRESAKRGCHWAAVRMAKGLNPRYDLRTCRNCEAQKFDGEFHTLGNICTECFSAKKILLKLKKDEPSDSNSGDQQCTL